MRVPPLGSWTPAPLQGGRASKIRRRGPASPARDDLRPRAGRWWRPPGEGVPFPDVEQPPPLRPETPVPPRSRPGGSGTGGRLRAGRSRRSAAGAGAHLVGAAVGSVGVAVGRVGEHG